MNPAGGLRRAIAIALALLFWLPSPAYYAQALDLPDEDKQDIQDREITDVVHRVREFWDKIDSDSGLNPATEVIRLRETILNQEIERAKQRAEQTWDVKLQTDAYENVLALERLKGPDSDGAENTFVLLKELYKGQLDTFGVHFVRGRHFESHGKFTFAAKEYASAIAHGRDDKELTDATERLRRLERIRTFRMATFLEQSASYKCQIDRLGLAGKVRKITESRILKRCEAEIAVAQSVQTALSQSPASSFQAGIAWAKTNENAKLKEHSHVIAASYVKGREDVVPVDDPSTPMPPVKSETLRILLAIDKKPVTEGAGELWLELLRKTFEDGYWKLGEMIFVANEHAADPVIDRSRSPGAYRAAHDLYDKHMEGKDRWHGMSDAEIDQFSRVGVQLAIAGVLFAVCWKVSALASAGFRTLQAGLGPRAATILGFLRPWMSRLTWILGPAGVMVGQYFRHRDAGTAWSAFTDIVFSVEGTRDIVFYTSVMFTVITLAPKLPFYGVVSLSAGANALYTPMTRNWLPGWLGDTFPSIQRWDRPWEWDELGWNVAFGVGATSIYGGASLYAIESVALTRAGPIGALALFVLLATAPNLVYVDGIDDVQLRHKLKPTWDLNKLPPLFNPHRNLPEDPREIARIFRSTVLEFHPAPPRG